MAIAGTSARDMESDFISGDSIDASRRHGRGSETMLYHMGFCDSESPLFAISCASARCASEQYR